MGSYERRMCPWIGCRQTLRRISAALRSSWPERGTDWSGDFEREAGRIDAELARAEAEGEDWAIAWRKRAPSFERIWGDVEQRVADFLKQAAALRSWLPLNERVASLAALGAKVSGADPAPARTVRALVGDLRERFATGNWAPVLDHADVAHEGERPGVSGAGTAVQPRASLSGRTGLSPRPVQRLSQRTGAADRRVGLAPSTRESRDRISPYFTRGQYRASGRRLSGCGLAEVEGKRGGTRPARARVGRISTDR